MNCTIFLVVLNVVIFFILSFGGMTEDGIYMLQHGAMYLPYFLEKQEYYRIITSLFLHFGFSHLAGNMVTLLIMGKYVEPVIGKLRFASIYLLSGIVGNIFSMIGEWFTEEYAISAGASGAIFGITGALLMLTILCRGRIRDITRQSMIIMIGISLFMGFTNQGVDNIAHIGGLLSGMLFTFLICPKKSLKM